MNLNPKSMGKDQLLKLVFLALRYCLKQSLSTLLFPSNRVSKEREDPFIHQMEGGLLKYLLKTLLGVSNLSEQ